MRGFGFALSCTLLVASLALVVWRQGRALEWEWALDRLRTENAVAEAERVRLVQRIQRLESRGRVVASARERLGLRVPTSGEIVLVPLPHAAEAGREAGR